MTVHVEVHQDRTTEVGPIYRVATSVTYASGISRSVFVYDTTTGLFAYVATVWDLEYYPDTRAAAQATLLPYYRQTAATVDYTTATIAIEAAAYTLSRIDTLVSVLNDTQVGFEGSDDYTYEDE
jgi:hypothetical protein